MQIDKVIIVASALIQNKKGEILLLQRSEKASYPHYWQLVEGKLETNEQPEDALKREIIEETQTLATKLKLNSALYNELEAKGLRYLCFRIVFNTKISSENIKLSDEHISFNWFNKSDALQLDLLPGTEVVIQKLI
ncbi:MAG: NUDIX domain-containing protein [Patescibacteria group bacterium]